MSEDVDLTPEEQALLAQISKEGAYGAPTPDPKHNTHTFLNMVANTKDTTRVGYLSVDELGTLRHSARTYKTVSLMADKIMDNKLIGDYFAAKAEIATSTSLSREGFLTKLSVVTKKEIADVTPEKKQNKSWFKKKEPDTSSMSS